MKSARRLIIAVDGPAGSGKSSIAQLVARQLGYRYIDTGAMYRAMAWLVGHRGISPADTAKVIETVRAAHLEIFPMDQGMGVCIDGRDVTGEIRSEAISAATSAIATIPQVRELMVELYRAQGRDGGVIIEGRDIGTVAFPDAELKIYLTASAETRAQRRLDQYGQANGGKDLQSIQDSINLRDTQDAGRKTAPLAKAADAVEVDTTQLTIDEVCARVLELAQQRLTGSSR